MKKVLLPLVILSFVLTGCGTVETVLKNDKGETRYCYTGSGINNQVAQLQYNQCLNSAGTAGFKRVE